MVSETALEKREQREMQTEQLRGSRVTYTPNVDIIEKDNEVLLVADLPGVRPDDLDLNYERGQLTLFGRVTPRKQPEDCVLCEYGVGDFYRRFEIGEGIDAGQIHAEQHDGELLVHLPKTPQLMPRKIEVRGA